MEAIEYTDIGHGRDCFHSTLWIYRDGKLEARGAAEGTHNSTWGTAAMRCYRGRFDTEAKLLSIAAPALYQLRTPSTELMAALKLKFDFKNAYYFSDAGCIKIESAVNAHSR